MVPDASDIPSERRLFLSIVVGDDTTQTMTKNTQSTNLLLGTTNT